MIAVVRLSPVSLESCLARRWVSLFLIFMLMNFFWGKPSNYLDRSLAEQHARAAAGLVDEFDAVEACLTTTKMQQSDSRLPRDPWIH